MLYGLTFCVGTVPGEGGGGDYVPSDGVWFSVCFVLNRASISSLSVLNKVSLHDLMAKQDKFRCSFIEA